MCACRYIELQLDQINRAAGHVTTLCPPISGLFPSCQRRPSPAGSFSAFLLDTAASSCTFNTAEPNMQPSFQIYRSPIEEQICTLLFVFPMDLQSISNGSGPIHPSAHPSAQPSARPEAIRCCVWLSTPSGDEDTWIRSTRTVRSVYRHAFVYVHGTLLLVPQRSAKGPQKPPPFDFELRSRA